MSKVTSQSMRERLIPENLGGRIQGVKKKLLGFGEHHNPCSYQHYRLVKTIHVIAVATLISAAAAAAVVGGVAALGAAGAITVPLIAVGGVVIAPALVAAAAMAAAAALLVTAAITSVCFALHQRYLKGATFGVLNGIDDKLFPIKQLGQAGNCEGLVCDNTVESFQWKKRLIDAAEHNIVMSGNYCGGESFNEILDLMRVQLERKPALKIVLLSSDRFINEENWERIHRLNEQYPERFQLVESPDIVHINPGIKKTTNHTKLLAIDYGKYFMQGGSGIDDRYARETGVAPGAPLESGIGSGSKGFVEGFLPDGFRDQDFVFHSPEEGGVGRLVYREGLKLALRWDGLRNKRSFDPEVPEKYRYENSESIAKELLFDESRDQPQVQPQTTITVFHEHLKKVDGCSTKILTTGPEHSYNPFEEEVVEQFTQANERIIIDHLYFHPSKRVMNALVDAANRGVKITVITNGYQKTNSPGGHMFFGPRNRYNISELYQRTRKSLRGNIQAYEYKVANKTLHKKVLVVDDTVIAGSSNLGYKSLGPMSDHEMNFITCNKEFADEAARVALEQDASIDKVVGDQVVEGLSTKVGKFRHSLRRSLQNWRHVMLAPIIG